jgi:hypothetical protein
VIDELILAAFHKHLAVREQPLRGRPRPAEGTTAADAWLEDRSEPQCGDPRARIHPELAARPLRAGSRDGAGVSAGDRIRRTPTCHLSDPASIRDPARPTIAQRNNAVLAAPDVIPPLHHPRRRRSPIETSRLSPRSRRASDRRRVRRLPSKARRNSSSSAQMGRRPSAESAP